MNSKELYGALDILLDLGLVPNIIGHKGEGKTQTVAKYAEERGYNYLNIRPSQAADAGDILGLADIIEINGEKASKFLAHSYLPRSGKWLVFIDEINRAQKDILQPIFELILEKTISLNGYSLPTESRIVTAMNPPVEGYDVTLFEDDAFWDRFVHIKFENSNDDWLEYMNGKYGKTNYAAFINLNRSLLTKNISDFSVDDFAKPSKRTGEFVIQLHNEAKARKLDSNLTFELISGLIGSPNAMSFRKYVEENSTPIDFAKFQESYSLVKADVANAIENNRIDVLDRLTSDVLDHVKTLEFMTDKFATSLVDYIVDLPVHMGYYLSKKLTTTTNKDNVCVALCKTESVEEFGIFEPKTPYGAKFTEYIDGIYDKIKDLDKMIQKEEETTETEE